MGEFSRICWPFFLGCDAPPLTNPLFNIGLLLGLAIGSVLSIYYLLFTDRQNLGFASLVLAIFCRLLLYAADFRLFGNYHLIPFFLAAAFFISPNELKSYTCMLVLCYFFAGCLKWNQEWISGSAIPSSQFGPLFKFFEKTPFPIRTTIWGFVPILECFISWGLLFFSAKARRRAIALFVIFHLISWETVGYFYPLTMLGFLTPLWISNRPIWNSPIKMRSALLLLGFCALQISALWRFPERAITGEGRWYTLSMYDASVQCIGKATLRFSTYVEPHALNFSAQGVRIACDPYLFFHSAKKLCESQKNNPEFIDLDLELRSKKKSDALLRSVINSKDFCRSNLNYTPWFKNPWILNESNKPHF